MKAARRRWRGRDEGRSSEKKMEAMTRRWKLPNEGGNCQTKVVCRTSFLLRGSLSEEINGMHDLLRSFIGKYWNRTTRHGRRVDIVLSTTPQYHNDRRKSLWRKQPYSQTGKLDPLHEVRTPKKKHENQTERRLLDEGELQRELFALWTTIRVILHG